MRLVNRSEPDTEQKPVQMLAHPVHGNQSARQSSLSSARYAAEGQATATAPGPSQRLGVLPHLRLSSQVQRKTTSGPKAVQRHISWNGGANQFEIDGTRPGWMGAVAAMAPGMLQSRNHIVPFETIQNDLCLALNACVANNGPATQQVVIDQTDALFPNATPGRATMIQRRDDLFDALDNGATGQYHARARALLSAMNSSPDNVRLGSRLQNWRIGENLDADFNPGITAFAGGLCYTNAGAAPVVVPPQNVLTLTPASNRIIYDYQQQTTQTMSFVLSQFTNMQISSGTGPGGAGAGANMPVLVTDPAGLDHPYLYQ